MESLRKWEGLKFRLQPAIALVECAGLEAPSF